MSSTSRPASAIAFSAASAVRLTTLVPEALENFVQPTPAMAV